MGWNTTVVVMNDALDQIDAEVVAVGPRERGADQRPVKAGVRFSMKALRPSLKSSLFEHASTSA